MIRTVAGTTRSAIRTRQWPILLAVLTVATGLAYTFWWPAVVRHQPHYWALPGDIWSAFRVAHMIAWGSISYSYSAHAGLVTLPGYEVLLSPLAAISMWMGLIESSPSVFLNNPTTWILIGPFVLASGLVPLVALDKVAEHLAMGRAGRRLCLLGAAIVMWPVTTIWGHPEDLLALGLVILSLLALVDGKMTRAGWLLGAAVSMQLLVVLLVPIMLAIAGRRRILALLLRASVIPGSLALAVLIPDFHDSWHALTSQPNFPKLNHATPWVLLSPHINSYTVAAGPGRIVGLVVALGCGLLAIRRRHDLRWVVWLAAVAMVGRCLFEAVVDPYYLAPGIVLAGVIAFTNTRLRVAIAILTGGFATVITYWRFNMWTWWLAMAVPLLILLWASYPQRSNEPDSAGAERKDATSEASPVPVLAG